MASTDEAASAVYPSLPDGCIRLLTILPGEGPICCALEAVRLDETLEYKALSYAWGAPPDSKTIEMNGQTRRVRKNLWRFLHQARQLGLGTPTTGRLWIDAVCINQQNDEERSQQVELMGIVYSRAARVLMWLGPAHGDSDKAMRLLKKPTVYWAAKRRIWKIWSAPYALALRNLCSRRYWTRLWIYQEVQLAVDIEVICGSHRLPWKSLTIFLNELRKTSRSQDTLLSSLKIRENIEYRNVVDSAAMAIVAETDNSAMTLMDHMKITHRLQCAEKHDKVYALLGIVNNGLEKITVDYTMPLASLLSFVIRDQYRIVQPNSIKEVEEDCVLLATFLGVEPLSIFDPRGHKTDCSGSTHPSTEEMMNFIPRSKCRVPLWWCDFYGLDAVSTLMFKRKWILPRDLDSAIETGQSAVVERLLRPGCIDVSKLLDPLNTAVRSGNSVVLHGLLNSGHFDVNERGVTGCTPLRTAAEFGDAAIISTLLQSRDMIIDARGEDDITPLHIAAKAGRPEAVRLLLSSGSDVHIRDVYGSTVLHCAIEGSQSWHIETGADHNKVIRTLLERDLTSAQKLSSAQDRDGLSPLHLLVCGEYSYNRDKIAHSTLMLLIECADDETLRSVDEKGKTILHCAALKGAHALVEALIIRCATIRDSEDQSGRTPASYAAAFETDSEACAVLKVLGMVDLKKEDIWGRTPLHYAATAGDDYEEHIHSVRYLLGTGRVVVDARDDANMTPFLDAVERNNTECAALLLAHGADVRAEGSFGFTAFEAAAAGVSIALPTVLSRHGLDVSQTLRERWDAVDLSAVTGEKRHLLEKCLQFNIPLIFLGGPTNATVSTYDLLQRHHLFEPMSDVEISSDWVRGLFRITLHRRQDVRLLIDEARRLTSNETALLQEELRLLERVQALCPPLDPHAEWNISMGRMEDISQAVREFYAV